MYNLYQLKVALRLSKLHFQILGTRAGDDDDEGFNGDNRYFINDTDFDKEIILNFSNSIKEQCQKYNSIRCNPQEKYRKADGSCNNRVKMAFYDKSELIHSF